VGNLERSAETAYIFCERGKHCTLLDVSEGTPVFRLIVIWGAWVQRQSLGAFAKLRKAIIIVE